MKRAAMMAIAALLVTGCADDGSDGAVTVTWTLGGTTCNQEGVSKIVVALYASGALIQDGEASCTDEELTLRGVEAGTYTVQVTGFRTGSTTPGLVGQARGITVPKGGAITVPSIELSEAPGAIDLSWRFESGRLCRFSGVEWISIGIWDSRNRRVVNRGLPCDPVDGNEDLIANDGADYLAEAEAIIIDQLFADDYSIVLLGYADASDDEALVFGSGDVTVAQHQLSASEIVLEDCPLGADSPCR